MVSSEWLSKQVSIFAVMDALGVGDDGPEETRQRLCPVHSEQRPSARVYAGDENRVFCFSCGRGWDVAGLVMAIQKVSYPQAATWLIETFGLGRGASLPAQVRAQLQTTTVTVAPLFGLVERSLRAGRADMPMEAFTRSAMALDVMRQQYQTHEIDLTEVRKGLTRILGYVKRHRRLA